MDKIDIIIWVAGFIILITILVGTFFMSLAYDKDFKECEKVIGCEKYKCFEDIMLFVSDKRDYKFDYQSCLLKELKKEFAQ